MPSDIQILGTLYVSSPRARLTLDHNSVKVITAEEDVHQFPLAGIDSIVAFSPNNVSIFLIERMADLGKPLAIFDYRGRFRARIVGPPKATSTSALPRCRPALTKLRPWRWPARWCWGRSATAGDSFSAGLATFVMPPPPRSPQRSNG
jgi:hypothetical protein